MKIYKFFEDLLFCPKWYHWILIVFLLPFSLIYMTILHFKFRKKPTDLKIPVISVGNIIVGGSGKTPVSIAVVNHFKNKKAAVVLRGYKRKSKGLRVVSLFGDIKEDVDVSGDEAMEIALKTDALVIVSEDRKEGVLKAKELGADFVVLDDGFDKPFCKLNIVIDIKIKNPFVLPAGGYRYPRLALKFADIVLKEGEDFKREVSVPKGDILISAISKPERLLKYWKKEYLFFPDHHDFKKEDLEKYKDKKIVCTYKDYVKLKKFDLKLEIMDLEVKLSEKVLKQIDNYLIKLQQKGGL